MFAPYLSYKKAFLLLCRVLPNKLFFKIAVGDKEQKSNYVHTFFAASSKFEKSTFERRILEYDKRIKFENGCFPVPQEEEVFLKTLYGDYMKIPSVEEQKLKTHAVYVDLHTSYETLSHLQKEFTFEIITRSIR